MNIQKRAISAKFYAFCESPVSQQSVYKCACQYGLLQTSEDMRLLTLRRRRYRYRWYRIVLLWITTPPPRICMLRPLFWCNSRINVELYRRQTFSTCQYIDNWHLFIIFILNAYCFTRMRKISVSIFKFWTSSSKL